MIITSNTHLILLFTHGSMPKTTSFQFTINSDQITIYLLQIVMLFLEGQTLIWRLNLIIILQIQSLAIMYNSHIFKKHSEQLQSQGQLERRNKKWLTKYKNSIRPALIERYSRRINNFVVRLQEDKKQLYEYREQTQSKAHQLLKQIYRKERFLGEAHIKLRDTKDWNSILTTTDRMEKEKNKSIFQSKYGDSSIAYRSIASQSAYNPAESSQFRRRSKDKEIHPHNMRFCYKSQSFSGNKKEKLLLRSRAQSSAKVEQPYLARRLNSNNSQSEQEGRSRAHSVFSFGGAEQMMMMRTNQQIEQHTSNNKQSIKNTLNSRDGASSKVYFKQIVDLYQNTKDPAVQKSLHQILVRFGVSRIKDIKKQAMAQTDNLQSDDF